MIIFIYYFLIYLLLALPRKKELGIIALFFLIVLFCFNTNIADREGYQIDMYNATYDDTISFEPLWNSILVFFELHKINIQFLYVLVGTVYLPALWFFIQKLTNNNNCALACYMLGIFYLDVVQLRYTFSLVFVIAALYNLFFVKGKKGDLRFICFMILALMVHLSNIILFLFYVAKYTSIKKTVWITIVSSIILFTSYTILISYFGDIFNMATKMQRINEGEYTSDNTFLLTALSCLAACGLMLLARKNCRLASNTDNGLILLTYKMALLLLMCIPLINFSQDVRRHIYVCFLIFAAITYRVLPYCVGRQQLKILPVLISLMYFVLSVFTGNRETVFFPLFRDNILFNIF